MQKIISILILFVFAINVYSEESQQQIDRECLSDSLSAKAIMQDRQKGVSIIETIDKFNNIISFEFNDVDERTIRILSELIVEAYNINVGNNEEEKNRIVSYFENMTYNKCIASDNNYDNYDTFKLCVDRIDLAKKIMEKRVTGDSKSDVTTFAIIQKYEGSTEPMTNDYKLNLVNVAYNTPIFIDNADANKLIINKFAEQVYKGCFAAFK